MRRTIMLFATLLLATLLSLSAAQATGGAMTGGAMMGGTEGTVETADGASIYYQMQGEGDPMLLIHGYPLNSGLFRDNVGPLSEQYQVITVDLRGFGQSTSPSEEGSIETYATDVLAVMDELGINQAIVGGMSMGGPIVFEMYRQAPERFSGMILNDTIDAAASPPEAGLWAGVAQQAEEMGVASLVDFLMPDMLTGETRMNQPELVEYLGSLMEEASQ